MLLLLLELPTLGHYIKNQTNFILIISFLLFKYFIQKTYYKQKYFQHGSQSSSTTKRRPLR